MTQPTIRQLEAKRLYEAQLLQIIDSPDCCDAQFAAAAKKIADDLGLKWQWRWDDELVVVWIDGESKLYYCDEWYEFKEGDQ